MATSRPHDDAYRHLSGEPLIETSLETSADIAGEVTKAASSCADSAARISDDCRGMIGDCLPIEAFADLIDTTSACIRHTLQLYDGIASQRRDLARFRAERQQVEADLAKPPTHLDAQGQILDTQAVDLRRVALCQARATVARATATEAQRLAVAARAAWISRSTQLDRVIAMCPTSRHVEALSCAHPPLPRPDGQAPEHTAASFLRDLVLEPLDEVATKLEAMESVWRDDLDWLISVGTTLTDRLVHLILTRHQAERVIDPAIDRLLSIGLHAAEAAGPCANAATQAVRAVRQAGVGQATWLRDLADEAARGVRCGAKASYRLAFELQVALWEDLRAARSVAAYSTVASSTGDPPEPDQDPFRMRLLAAQRLTQRLGRTMRGGVELLAETSRFGHLGADMAEIAAWSAAVVADPGASTNLQVFFLRRDRCRV